MKSGVTISRSDTSRNILKNCVLSIIIGVLFAKNEDLNNYILQMHSAMILFNLM